MKFYFSRILELIKFVFCPSLIKQKEKITGRESCRIEFKENGLPLIVSFAGLGEPYNFVKTLKGVRANIIYLRDPNHNWYLNGLYGVGDTVKEVANFLHEKQKLFESKTVCVIGASAGGFAAILYGQLLSADKVLS